MKKYLLIMVIFISVGCTKKQQDNSIVISHNYTIPETFLFEIDSCTFLTDGTFNLDIPDSTTMYKFDRNTTIQLKKIMNTVFYEYIIACHDGVGSELFLTDDSLNDGINFFLYGKLNLQPNVNSLVLLEFDQYVEVGNFDKNFWLLNIKENRLCSVVLLSYASGVYTDPPPSYSKTYLKNGMFTTIKVNTNTYPFPDNILTARENKDLFTSYQINKDGFIEFLRD